MPCLNCTVLLDSVIYCYHYTCFRLSLFSDVNISQGSVATLVRCGEIFNANFIANFLTSQPVKEYENWQTSDEFITKVKGGRVFETQCSVRNTVKVLKSQGI